MSAVKENVQLNWPDVFQNPELIKTREPAALCADALCAWGNCHMGIGPIPDNFGEVLVAIGQRLGMLKATTSENLCEHARQIGWLKD